jgi:hypothetical protein
VPFNDNAVADAVSVIVEPFGAKSGTFSQPEARAIDPMRATDATMLRRRAIFKILSILKP